MAVGTLELEALAVGTLELEALGLDLVLQNPHLDSHVGATRDQLRQRLRADPAVITSLSGTRDKYSPISIGNTILDMIFIPKIEPAAIANIKSDTETDNCQLQGVLLVNWKYDSIFK